MQISEERIKEFQEIWKKEFSEELSREKAINKATNLINLMKAIYKRKQSEKEIVYGKQTQTS